MRVLSYEAPGAGSNCLHAKAFQPRAFSLGLKNSSTIPHHRLSSRILYPKFGEMSSKNVIQECKIPSPKAILNGFLQLRFNKAKLQQPLYHSVLSDGSRHVIRGLL